MKPQTSVIGHQNNRIALIFDGRLRSNGAVSPAKFEDDLTTLNVDPAPSRFHETLRKDIFFDVETGPALFQYREIRRFSLSRVKSRRLRINIGNCWIDLEIDRRLRSVAAATPVKFKNDPTPQSRSFDTIRDLEKIQISWYWNRAPGCAQERKILPFLLQGSIYLDSHD